MADFIISTEIQCENALNQVFQLMQTQPAIGTPEGETLNLLVTIIEQYEAIHYPIKIKL